MGPRRGQKTGISRGSVLLGFVVFVGVIELCVISSARNQRVAAIADAGGGDALMVEMPRGAPPPNYVDAAGGTVAPPPPGTRPVVAPPPRTGPAAARPPQPRPPASTKRKTVAYAISITGDASGEWHGIDGAAVLGHSAVRAHRGGSRYDAALVAFVAPSVSAAGRRRLEAVGYRVLEKALPVEVEAIEGDYLRARIGSNGCCGAWELLKLYAWTLEEYHRVVHLDVDSLVLRNLDELFDDDPADGGAPASAAARGYDAKLRAAAAPVPARVEDAVYAQFTYDWNMAQRPWGANPPVQGGFFVARPSLAVYDELVAIVKKGDFRGGWGGTKAGNFYGGMTIQGLLPYYFRHVRPSFGREVRACVYNNMASNPRDAGGFGKGACRDGTRPDAAGQYTGSIAAGDCDDCRLTDVEDVKVVHFTICQKPWTCHGASTGCYYCPICAKFHREWFLIREEFEGENGVDLGRYDGTVKDRRGMCKTTGEHGYVPIDVASMASKMP